MEAASGRWGENTVGGARRFPNRYPVSAGSTGGPGPERLCQGLEEERSAGKCPLTMVKESTVL